MNTKEDTGNFKPDDPMCLYSRNPKWIAETVIEKTGPVPSLPSNIDAPGY